MRKRIPGIVLAILCLFAGGMYAMRHDAGFFMPEHGAESMQGAERTADLTAASASEVPEPININTAGAKELEKLPGIGPAKAAAILEYRKTHGFFRVPEDLMKVSGIKEGTFGKLAELITVGELPDIGSDDGWPGVLLPLEKAGAGREESVIHRRQEDAP
ncbi:MAG: helix-hairpin-helix domain-containing protein [Lachnospiraceae bacterium]|nr:helix-hairpin-helix domain-containing protein [Lachnospiraceae bacterium]